MNIRDFLIEEISFGGEVTVATINENGTEIHWSGNLHPGVEEGLRTETGAFPDWLAEREVVVIGAAKNGSLMIAVE